MHARLFGSAALAALILAAQPAQASTTLATLGGYADGAPLDGISASNGDTVTPGATGSSGVTLI